MANAVIGGRAYWISPFRLRELRLAAPFIDQVSARAGPGALSTVQDASEAAYAMLCVLAVGIEGADADQLAAEASLEELSALRTAFEQVMTEAGLRPEENAPPGERQPALEPARPSPTASTTSPPNSSPAAAATGTPSSAAST